MTPPAIGPVSSSTSVHTSDRLCDYGRLRRAGRSGRGRLAHGSAGHPQPAAGQVGADAIDAQLHGERLEPTTRAQHHHDEPIDGLPDGAFVLHDRAPHVVCGGELLAWTPAGYSSRHARPAARRATVITPASLVEVLRSGWRPLVPLLHPSAKL